MNMNFQTIEIGANFYIISTNGGLTVNVGTVKGKSAPYWPMPANGLNSQLVDITVSFNGQDRVIPGLPIGLDAAGRDPETYTVSRELAERLINEKIAEAKKILQNIPYYKKMESDGPKCLEIINPEYANTRKQTETIEQLQAKAAATERELQEMKAQNAEMLKLLKEALGGKGKKGE
jgi:peptidoglycan hydrolase-like amidase